MPLSNKIISSWINKRGEELYEKCTVKILESSVHDIYFMGHIATITEIFWNGGYYVCKVTINNCSYNFTPDDLVPVDVDLGI